jgi:hypothetical protein
MRPVIATAGHPRLRRMQQARTWVPGRMVPGRFARGSSVMAVAGYRRLMNGQGASASLFNMLWHAICAMQIRSNLIAGCVEKLILS